METSADNKNPPKSSNSDEKTTENDPDAKRKDENEDNNSVNGDIGSIITQKDYGSEKEKEKKPTNVVPRENNGGLIIVDISKNICKADSDDSESADDFLSNNDIIRNKGLKRKASDAARSGDDDGSHTTETDDFGSAPKKSLKGKQILFFFFMKINKKFN